MHRNELYYFLRIPPLISCNTEGKRTMNQKSKQKAMKQSTIGAWKGFTKSVLHNNKKVPIVVPQTVSEESGGIRCEHCPKTFKNNQGYAVHLKCVHLKCECDHSENPSHVANNTKRSIDVEVKKVVGKLVSDVTTLLETKEPTTIDLSKEKSNRRGSEKRRNYSALFKAEVIEFIEANSPDVTQEKAAEKYSVSQSNISKWWKNKDAIVKEAATKNRKQLTKMRRGTKYDELFAELLKQVKTARSKGYLVNFGWLWNKARKIYRTQVKNPNALVQKHVITTFLRRSNIRMRARQRNRKYHKEHYRSELMKWHGLTRERLVRTGLNDDYHTKWGRFPPNMRFNVDQSPLPFVIDHKRTYEVIEEDQRYRKVWIQQPRSGLDKRQCTLQVCIRAEGEQPKIAIIFRGTGKRLKESERLAYHPLVDVYFQANAWADTPVSVEWVEKTLKNSVKGLARFILFLDNLTAQNSDAFNDAVSALKGVNWYGLPNATDLWQVVDAGVAELLKVLTRMEQDKWLDDESNADRWYGHTDEKKVSFTASERRILITNWCGEAWKKLTTSGKYDTFLRGCWERTGCLITADGSEDAKIKPEGLPNYVVPPPIDYVEPMTSEPSSNTVPEELSQTNKEGHTPEEEILEDEEEPPADDEAMLLDEPEDRDFSDELVGLKLKVLYETGWVVGVVEYYNRALKEYKVCFEDGSTDDFISEDDIGGGEVEVILE